MLLEANSFPGKLFLFQDGGYFMNKPTFGHTTQFSFMQLSQKVRVTKKFSFDMAHALYGYDGPCKNIHGHTYHLSVTLIGTPLQDASNVKLGMVVDFGDLKKIVKELILDSYDHALVLNEEAPYSKSEVISNEFEKVILVPYQPTCENLLLHFVSILKDCFPTEMKLVSIRLEETPSSFAEWDQGDN
ncbi:6-carboxy-5,6,7,8-tetrahydropterin synthase [Filimonas sp.]|nr:6-carboxy-5,6,7,8-tetrahydropterin synthase [Filimonas sp.]